MAPITRSSSHGSTPARRVFALGLGLCVLLSGAACNTSRAPAPTASASASASASAKRSAARQPPPVASTTLRPTQHCRAIKVAGDVLSSAGTPLKRGDEIDGSEWLTLKDGGSVVVRHALSSREYAISGPGRVHPCHQGEEEVLLALGEFKATSGGGARPGAFVTLATPWGTLRYGNADAVIRATSQAAEVSVNTGTVWVDAAQGAKLSGEPKLTGPKAKAKLQATSKFSVDTLIEACEADAKTAEDKAEALLKGRHERGFGAQAAEHVRLRAAARRSCQVAQAALGLAIEPAKAAALEKRLDSANQRWRRVPLSFSQKRQQE